MPDPSGRGSQRLGAKKRPLAGGGLRRRSQPATQLAKGEVGESVRQFVIDQTAETINEKIHAKINAKLEKQSAKVAAKTAAKAAAKTAAKKTV